MESTLEEVSVDVILPLDVVMGADSKEITAGGKLRFKYFSYALLFNDETFLTASFFSLFYIVK